MPLTLATFNLKDFFPQPPHDFAPKVAWVADMVARADADVVARQEVGPPETLEALLARLERRGAYGAPVIGTPDARGIRCALLSRLPVIASRVHTAESLPFPVFQHGDAPPFGARIPLRRGVVVAQIDGGSLGVVDVIVAHFKSRRWVPLRDANGQEVPPTTAQARAEAELRSLVWRAAEALCGRRIGLGESLEQPRLLLRRHADAVIGHGELDPVASVDQPSHLELYLALLCELAGIAQ